MADSTSFDFSAIDQLAADIGNAGKNIDGPLITAMNVSSGKIQRVWQEKLAGSEYLPHLARAISWDVTTFAGFGASIFKSEIGFDKARSQGPLGNISEFGTPHNPPRGFGRAALLENEGDFVIGVGKAIEASLKAVNL